MAQDRVIVTTHGAIEQEGGPLLFVETGRAGAADEAFFLVCESSAGGKRLFREAIAQYKRGSTIRTPENYVGLLREMASSCDELQGAAPVSFGAGVVRSRTAWWAVGGDYRAALLPAGGSLRYLEGSVGVDHLEPQGKLIVGEAPALEKPEREAGALWREGSGQIGRAIEVELEVSHSTRGNTRTERAVRRSSPLKRLRGAPRGMRKTLVPRLSPFGWISVVGTFAIVVVLVLTVLPSSRKSRIDEGKRPRQSRKSDVVSPADTSEQVSSVPSVVSLSLKWKKSFGAPVTSSPVVYEERVYFGGRDGGLYCFDSRSGKQLWKFPAGAGIGARPAVADQRVFVGCYDGRFWCVDARSGQKMWEFRTAGKIVSSAFVASGNVLFGSYDRNLYCLTSRDGKLRWKYEAEGVIWCSPAAEQGRVFFGSLDGSFYCVSIESGKLLWKSRVGGAIYSSPGVMNGLVCFGSNERVLHFLDSSTGKELFKVQADGEVRASPLMSGGMAYAGSDDGHVICVDLKKRAVAWSFKASRAVRSTPCLFGKVLLVTSYDGKLHVLEAVQGREMSSFDAGAEIYSSPFVSADMAYFGDNNGNFYCVQINFH